MDRLMGTLAVFAGFWISVGVVIGVIVLAKPLGFWGFPILWSALFALIYGGFVGKELRRWWAKRD